MLFTAKKPLQKKKYRMGECRLMVIRHLEMRIEKCELAGLILINKIKKRGPASSVSIHGIEN